MKVGTKLLILELAISMVLLGGMLSVFHHLIIPWQEENYSASGRELARVVQKSAQSFNATALEEMISSMDAENDWISYIFVVDAASRVTADSTRSGRSPWELNSPQLNLMLSGKADTEVDFTADLDPSASEAGLDRHIVNMALPMYNSMGIQSGAIVLGMSMDQVQSMNQRYYETVFLFALIWMMIIGISNMLFWKNVVQPLNEIAHAARLMKDNKYTGWLHKEGSDEISVLANDFNEMAERLSTLIQALTNSESDLTNQVNYLNHLIDNMNEYFFTYDLDGRISMVNRKFCETFGYQREEIMGRTILFFISEKFQGKVSSEIKKRLETGETGSYEVTGYYRDGSEHHMRINSAAMTQNGVITGGIVLAEDIDSEKQAELYLRQARDELELRVRSRTRELENSNQRLNAEISERIKVEAALIKSEQKLLKQVDYLNMLINNMNEAFFTYGRDGNIDFINSTFTEMLGYGAEEKIGTGVAGLVVPEARPTMLDHISNRLFKGLTDSYEITFECKDGSHKILRLNGSPIFEDGRVVGGMVLGEDISDYRQAERALQASEEKFSSAFRYSPMLMAIVSLSDGRYIDVNETWNNYFGFTEGEALAANAKRVSIWTKGGERRILWDVIGAGHTVYNAEFRARKKNGESIMCLWSCTPIWLKGEICALLVGSDISERKKAEEALAAEKDRVSVTLSNIGEGVITTDANGQIILMNDVVQTILNKAAAEFVGQHIVDLLTEFNIKVDTGIMFLGKEQEEKEELSNVLFNVSLEINHDERIIEVNRASIVSADGVFNGHVWVMRDITEKLKMEEESIKASKLESLGVLAGGIAHDFNNLLTVIAGNLALCKMILEDNEEIQEFLLEAEKASFQAKGLTKQLLTFARGGTPDRQTTDIMELIHDTAIFAVSGTKVHCEFDIQDNLWAVDIDKSEMSQVINNIVINGIQAMPSGGSLSIKAENIRITEGEILPLARGDYVKLAIRDQGIGISEEQQRRIFDPYYTTREDGSGLGLAISHSIVTKHQGYIDLDSRPGQGTTFHIYLPASRVIETGLSQGSGEAADGQAAGYKGAILLLDDEPEMSEVTGHILNVLGYYVQVASSGRDAVDMYRDYYRQGSAFNLVIMDTDAQSGMGLQEAARRIMEVDPGAYMVVSSGFSNDPMANDFSAHGFRGFIAKPYGMMELSSLLDSIPHPGSWKPPGGA